MEPTGAEDRGHRREGRGEEGCLGGMAECERDCEGALDGSRGSAEGLERGDACVSRLKMPPHSVKGWGQEVLGSFHLAPFLVLLKSLLSTGKN